MTHFVAYLIRIKNFIYESLEQYYLTYNGMKAAETDTDLYVYSQSVV